MQQILVQYTVKKADRPTLPLTDWAKTVLDQQNIQSAEITIRIVSTTEMTQLNQHYRKKSGPTNVLSFPYQRPEQTSPLSSLIGDIVICADVVKQEASANNQEAHWAHMVVHGVLHLLGYDHETEQQASIMEPLETIIMKNLGFADPYRNSYDH